MNTPPTLTPPPLPAPGAPAAPEFAAAGTSGPDFRVGPPLPQPAPGLSGHPLIATAGPVVQPVMRWKDLLIIDRYGPPLPQDRCLTCNEPSSRSIRRTLTWTRPATTLCLIILCIVLTILAPIWLVLYLTGQTRAAIDLPTCEHCLKRRSTKQLFWVGVLVLGMPIFGFGIVQDLLLVAALGILGILVGLVGLVCGGQGIAPQRIDERWIHLRGAGSKYLAAIPASPIPPS